jgi:nuclear transport factor 2 (NTF2) superfamily protein
MMEAEGPPLPPLYTVEVAVEKVRLVESGSRGDILVRPVLAE